MCRVSLDEQDNDRKSVDCDSTLFDSEQEAVDCLLTQGYFWYEGFKLVLEDEVKKHKGYRVAYDDWQEEDSGKMEALQQTVAEELVEYYSDDIIRVDLAA